MVSGACSQRPLFFALAMSAISLSGRKSLDAAQVRRVEELSEQPEPPPLPHLCQARVFRGAQQCSRTPLPGSSFCFQHQDCLLASQCMMCRECTHLFPTIIAVVTFAHEINSSNSDGLGFSAQTIHTHTHTFFVNIRQEFTRVTCVHSMCRFQQTHMFGYVHTVFLSYFKA